MNYIFYCLGKTDKDFLIFEKAKINVNKNIKNINSNIISSKDFITVSMGIQKSLNKMIKEVKLLYKFSKDGPANFHSKCDNKKNTLTFFLSENGRRYGGFASKKWHSYGNNEYYYEPEVHKESDDKSFLFSLDLNECYHSKYNSKLFIDKTLGPSWGGEYSDLRTENYYGRYRGYSSQTCSFQYYGKNKALFGESQCEIKDFETYELTFE